MRRGNIKGNNSMGSDNSSFLENEMRKQNMLPNEDYKNEDKEPIKEEKPDKEKVEEVEKEEKKEINDVNKYIPLSQKEVRKVALVITVASIILGVMSIGFYNTQIRRPSEMIIDTQGTPLQAILGIKDGIDELKSDKSTSNESLKYLNMEYSYANGDKDIEEFMTKVISTVEIKPKEITKLNKYGNPYINEDGEKEIDYSLTDKEYTIQYIDWEKIQYDSDIISQLVAEEKLEKDDPDYSNKLVKVFVKYINSLEELPTKSEKRTVDQANGVATEGEGNYIDKLLFSSQEFRNAKNTFAEMAYGGSLIPTEEWSEWANKSEKDREKLQEPKKYEYSMSDTWCGAYYLSNEYKAKNEDGEYVTTPILAGDGQGTLENPAGLNTSVVSYVRDEDDKLQKVRVELVDFKRGEDAIKYFESKDEKNRGFDIKSKVQYISYAIKVTNISDKELTVYDNSALSDDSANVSVRTGTMYGLTESKVLKPGESVNIESWAQSTDLDSQYLIWGKDFAREKEVVFFKVLAGSDDNEEK